MTDKEKILKKIHEEMDELVDAQGNFFYAEDEAAYNALCDLGEYIDSLPEETGNEDLEEAAGIHALQCHSKKASVATLAASKYDFIAGAQWKKEYIIDKVCEWLKDHLWEYDQYSCIPIDVDDLVKDFKQAMED